MQATLSGLGRLNLHICVSIGNNNYERRGAMNLREVEGHKLHWKGGGGGGETRNRVLIGNSQTQTSLERDS